MIAAIGPADIPSLVLALTGVVPLAVIVRRQRAGRPLLSTVEKPFRAVSPELPLLVAGGLFVVYALGLWLAASGKTGILGRAAGIAVPFGAAILAALIARRLVLLPRGPLAWRVGMGLLVFWAAFPFILATFRLCLLFGDEQPQVDVLRKRADGWPWLAATAVLVAPVVEEVTFRGLLYPALRQRFRMGAAVALSSVAFVLVHHPPTVWLPLLILAVVLAWLVETTGSVVPSIAAHMALNGLTVATVLLGG